MLRRLLTRWRLARGLRWEKPNPYAHDLGIDAHGVLMLLLIIALFSVGSTLDYAHERAAAAAQEQARADAYRQAVLACLNKGGFYYPDTKTTFACEAYSI